MISGARMFTGIISQCSHITSWVQMANGLRIGVALSWIDLVLGESIAIDGMCLTIAEIDQDIAYFELSPETCAVTTAQYWKLHTPVHIERALRVGDSLGGHFVSGHVDAMAQVHMIKPQTDFCEYQFVFQASVAEKASQQLMMIKGSITVNGVSLTVNALDASHFSVMLVPHTLYSTHLSRLQVGDFVNIEYDMLHKMVAATLSV
jgi:riboflavin synthase